MAKKAASGKKKKATEKNPPLPDAVGELCRAYARDWQPGVPELPPPEQDAKAMAKTMATIRIVKAIGALREGRHIERSTALFLADALETTLFNPAKAVEAFGIKRSRGRGTSHSDASHRKLAMHVHTLKKMGFSLSCSNKDRGAYERVSETFHISVDTVKRSWKEHRSFLEMQDTFENLEALKPNE
jgi:hypothetical protein